MSDSLLWTCFKSGSTDAFSTIYCNHYRKLFHYGSRLTSDTELVKDSIHDLFLDLWTRRANLGETSSIKYYLFKCLRRRIVKTTLRTDIRGLEGNFKRVESPEEEFLRDEKSARETIHIFRTMSKLTRRQRQAIYMRFYYNLDTKDIATAMSLSSKGAANLISKGIIALRSNLMTEMANI